MGSGQSFEEKQKKIDQSFKEKQEKVGEMVESWKDLKCNTLELVEKYRLICVVDAFEDYYKAMKKRTGKNIIMQGPYVCDMVTILIEIQVGKKDMYGSLLDYCLENGDQYFLRTYQRKVTKLQQGLNVWSEEHPCDLKF